MAKDVPASETLSNAVELSSHEPKIGRSYMENEPTIFETKSLATLESPATRFAPGTRVPSNPMHCLLNDDSRVKVSSPDDRTIH